MNHYRIFCLRETILNVRYSEQLDLQPQSNEKDIYVRINGVFNLQNTLLGLKWLLFDPLCFYVAKDAFFIPF